MGSIQIKDQMGFEIILEDLPRRIVSLVPSQTELLYDLGLEDRIVGVTKFCVHPDRARKTKTIIGGTKKFDLERIAALQPDLIIGNKEENYPEGISFLKERFPVWMSDVIDLPDARAMIEAVANLTGAALKGLALSNEIRERFRHLKKLAPLRTLYLMWHDPWMGAAGGTFIHSIMAEAGLVNVLADQQRYPQIKEEGLTRLNPELVLLSSEPFPFTETHRTVLQHLLPGAKILLVDGEHFSWYGSRLRQTPTYLQSLEGKLN